MRTYILFASVAKLDQLKTNKMRNNICRAVAEVGQVVVTKSKSSQVNFGRSTLSVLSTVCARECVCMCESGGNCYIVCFANIIALYTFHTLK